MYMGSIWDYRREARGCPISRTAPVRAQSPGYGPVVSLAPEDPVSRIALAVDGPYCITEITREDTSNPPSVRSIYSDTRRQSHLSYPEFRRFGPALSPCVR